MVNLKDIHVDPHLKLDDRFVRLWAEWLVRKRKSYLSRIEIDRIDVGVRTRRKDGVIEWSTDKIQEDHIQSALRSLRVGARPLLAVYCGQQADLFVLMVPLMLEHIMSLVSSLCHARYWKKSQRSPTEV